MIQKRWYLFGRQPLKQYKTGLMMTTILRCFLKAPQHKAIAPEVGLKKYGYQAKDHNQGLAGPNGQFPGMIQGKIIIVVIVLKVMFTDWY